VCESVQRTASAACGRADSPLRASARSFKAQQATGEPPRVLGCLLGSHSGRTVDIANSFEIKYDGFVNGVPQLDGEFLTKKQDQCAHRRARRTALLGENLPDARRHPRCRSAPAAQTRRSSPSVMS
jgi:hypothetical protein